MFVSYYNDIKNNNMSIYSIRLFGVFNSYKVKIASTFNIFIFYLARWYQVVGVSYLLYIVRFCSFNNSFIIWLCPLFGGFLSEYSAGITKLVPFSFCVESNMIPFATEYSLSSGCSFKYISINEKVIEKSNILHEK